ncbi:uncharacterized protein TNCV_1360391 [Trichonephila clavipes]|nr:uncharacterized protein TNCV_1360391 [Trichonephila clavipes]
MTRQQRVRDLNHCPPEAPMKTLFRKRSMRVKSDEAQIPHVGSDNNGEHLLTRTERSFGGNKIEPPSRPNSYWDDPHYRPYFDNSTERNATAQLGKTAYLNCKIRQLGDRTVGANMTYKQRSLLLVLEVITVGIQHLLPTCLQFFNSLAVKLGCVGRKEVRDSLSYVCFIGEGFTTKMIVQGMEEIVI